MQRSTLTCLLIECHENVEFNDFRPIARIPIIMKCFERINILTCPTMSGLYWVRSSSRGRKSSMCRLNMSGISAMRSLSVLSVDNHTVTCWLFRD